MYLTVKNVTVDIFTPLFLMPLPFSCANFESSLFAPFIKFKSPPNMKGGWGPHLHSLQLKIWGGKCCYNFLSPTACLIHDGFWLNIAKFQTSKTWLVPWTCQQKNSESIISSQVIDKHDPTYIEKYIPKMAPSNDTYVMRSF